MNNKKNEIGWTDGYLVGYGHGQKEIKEKCLEYLEELKKRLENGE